MKKNNFKNNGGLLFPFLKIKISFSGLKLKNLRVWCIIIVFFFLHFPDVFFSLSIRSFAQQNRGDSLENLLKSAIDDTLKIELLNTLCAEYTVTSKFKEALERGNNALWKAEETEYKKGIADANNNLGRLFWSQSNYEEAPKYYLKAIELYEELKNIKGLAGAYNNLGIIYDEQGDYPKGLDYYFKGLKLRESIGDRAGMAGSYTNLGIIYSNQGKLDVALEYYQKGLKIKEELNDKRGMSNSFTNIGNIYYDINNYPLALEYYHKSRELEIELQNKQGLGYCYINIGNLFSKVYGFSEDSLRKIFPVFKNIGSTNMIGRILDSAGFYQTRAFSISKELEDAGGMAYCLKMLGDIAFRKKEINKAINYYLDAARLSDSLGMKKELSAYYNVVSDGYAKISDYKKAFDYHKLYSVTKDSLLNEESNKNAAEMQAKYESEKKDNEIKLLNKDKEISLAESKRKNIVIMLVTVGLLSVIVFSVYVFRSLRVTKKQKRIIELQKNEVSRQKDMVEKQKSLIESQKHLVEEHRKEMIDSITYAKRIQNAILAKEEDIKKHFPESFLLYKPKDIVAGDFYFFEHVAPDPEKSDELPENSRQFFGTEVIFIAACDCTGHGVPGAMVSVVCSNALTRCLREFRLKNTGEILDKARELVLETFQKSGMDIKDGMDISLLSVEFLSHPNSLIKGHKISKIQWSGANNPLWYFENGAFREIVPDKQPVGKVDIRKPFSTHKISITNKPGETALYLFTDGYPDQFGGPKGKKFKYRQLETLLNSIQEKPMAEQKEILNDTIEKWKGELEQVDDICIIGLRV